MDLTKLLSDSLPTVKDCILLKLFPKDVSSAFTAIYHTMTFKEKSMYWRYSYMNSGVIISVIATGIVERPIYLIFTDDITFKDVAILTLKRVTNKLRTVPIRGILPSYYYCIYSETESIQVNFVLNIRRTLIGGLHMQRTLTYTVKQTQTINALENSEGPIRDVDILVADIEKISDQLIKG